MNKSAGDIIILHMCTKNHNHKMYSSWDMSATDRIFCHYGVFFALLPPYAPRKSKFWKKKQTNKLEDIVILQMFTINDSHMICGFSDIECNRQNVFVILDRFLPFYPPNNPKNRNFEKLKRVPLEYHHFTQVYQKSWSYAILLLRYGV